MAHPDLNSVRLRALVSKDVQQAFSGGDEQQAALLLARARDQHQPGSAEWAWLERLYGLALIHLLREVEGTFALERADAVLERRGLPLPDLTLLEDY